MLVHGVGFGPATLTRLASTVAERARVLVISRRGYGARAAQAPARTVAEHVADLFGELDGRGIERVVLAGMSGGATVALAAAIERPGRVIVAIAHEPAVGSVSPELLRLIRGALATGGGRQLARFLAGERTWRSLDPDTLAALTRSQQLIEADALAFAAYEPALPPPAARLPLVCSLGERSGATRRQVAERLSRRTGAPIELVPDCGHLPQLEAPEAFAELILTHATERTPA